MKAVFCCKSADVTQAFWLFGSSANYMCIMQADVKDKAAETDGPEDVVVHDSVARPASPQHRWRHQRYRPLHSDGADSPFNADSSDGSV